MRGDTISRAICVYLHKRTSSTVLICLFTIFFVCCYEAHVRSMIQDITEQTIISHLAPEPLNDSKQLKVPRQERSVLENQPSSPTWLPQKTPATELAQRRARVLGVCRSSQQKEKVTVKTVLTHKSGIIYCVVPKAGCTFWKRTFAAANGLTNGTAENIFSISRNWIHTSPNIGEKFSPKNHSSKLFPTRFIVTRDPYSRMLSSYLDKAYLPDFWISEFKLLIKKQIKLNKFRPGPESDFLRQHFNQMAAIFERQAMLFENSTATMFQCGKYLTFSEYVRLSFYLDEPHWMPIYKICNPCQFNVTHVNRIETFVQDTRVILSQMGMEHIIDNMTDNTQVDEEMKMIVNYNFNIITESIFSDQYKSCVSPSELAYRLWHNFQWRGYIDPEMEYLMPVFTDNEKIQEDLLQQLQQARLSGLQHPERMGKAKADFKRKAWSTLSKQLFDRFSHVYEEDFKMFGYENVRYKLRASYT